MKRTLSQAEKGAQPNRRSAYYGMGAGWKSRKNAKAKYGKSTPGKQKGANCQADPLTKGMMRHNRAYRSHPQEYLSVIQGLDKVRRGKGS